MVRSLSNLAAVVLTVLFATSLTNSPLAQEQGAIWLPAREGTIRGLPAAIHAARQARNEVRVVHVGAHPDDELSALVAWLARGKAWRTAYLSATRGEGGQNAIGPERGAAIGMIRTEELIAARELDGAEQYFLDLADFGFSKSAEETLNQWDEERAVAGLVRFLRWYRPRFVISCWAGNANDGHGHHQAVGMLCRKAWKLAGDDQYRPESSELAWDPGGDLEPFQPDALLVSRWRRPDHSDLEIDTGIYDPVYGLTYAQLAAEGRSLHRSQAMGTPEDAGPHPVWLQLEETADGVTQGDVIAAFRPPNVSAAYPDRQGLFLLWEQYRADKHLHLEGLARVAQALFAQSGMAVDLLAHEAALALPPPNDTTLTFELRLQARDESAVVLNAEIVSPEGWLLEEINPLPRNLFLPRGDLRRFEFRVTVPAHSKAGASLRNGTLHWDFLSTGTMANRPWRGWRTLARDSSPPLYARLTFQALGSGVEMPRLVVAAMPVHVRVDPIYGESRTPLRMEPSMTFDIEPERVIADIDGITPRELRVRTRHRAEGSSVGGLALDLPPGWSLEPERSDAELAAWPLGRNSGYWTTGRRVDAEGRSAVTIGGFLPRHAEIFEERIVELHPGAELHEGRWRIPLRIMDSWNAPGDAAEPPRVSLSPAFRARRIRYPHLPERVYYDEPQLRLTVADLEVPEGLRVAYVAGSGDEIVPVLREAGVTVEEISPLRLADTEWGEFDTVITGIRAYEFEPRLVAANERLMEWVRGGGTLVVQYNRYPFEELGVAPYPFRFRRPHDRLTVETAEIEILQPDSPILNYPHSLVPGDLRDWTQELSLYEFGEFSEEDYRPILSGQDPGEAEHRGLLLEARVGEGRWIYSALSLFRQLPAGHPGALKLMINLAAQGRAGRAEAATPDEEEPAIADPR